MRKTISAGAQVSRAREDLPPAMPRSIDIGNILDEGEWSIYQKGVLLLISLVILLDGFDTQTLTLALPAITREWNVGRAVFGPLLAVSYVSMAAGTAMGGLIGDRFGRRRALLLSVAIFGVGTVAGSFAHGVFSLGLTRVVAAVGLGAAMPNATAMATEFTPRRHRNIAVGVAMGSVALGGFVGGAFAAYILPLSGWRELFLWSGLIPLCGGLLLLFLLPESPRYLLNRGGSAAQLTAILRRISPSVRTADGFSDRSDPPGRKASLTELFIPGHRRDTLALAGAFFLVIFANLFVLSWAPSLLADLGYGLGITSAGAATFSIGGLLGAIAGAFLITRIGSRLGLPLMMAGAAATALLLAFLPLRSGHADPRLLSALLLVGGVFIPGTQVLLFSLAGQAYPTAIRATGVGFAAAVGRMGAVTSALVGPLLLLGGQGAFFVSVAAAMLLSAVCVMAVRTHIQAQAL